MTLGLWIIVGIMLVVGVVFVITRRAKHKKSKAMAPSQPAEQTSSSNGAPLSLVNRTKLSLDKLGDSTPCRPLQLGPQRGEMVLCRRNNGRTVHMFFLGHEKGRAILCHTRNKRIRVPFGAIQAC